MAPAYDPLDYNNLARSVVDALLNSPAIALPPKDSFGGSGVYALFYRGALPYYSKIVASSSTPIYVGKAVPSGARKGSTKTSPERGTALYRRLHDHARSIDQAENLDLVEFQCRFLVVEPVWITLAERFLLDHYQPVWNTIIDGFGNHDPGSGRRNMRRPRWDIVHPGRPWAARLQATEPVENITLLLD